MGLREYSRAEAHTWILRLEKPDGCSPANFLVGVAPPNMDPSRSLGEVRRGRPVEEGR